MAGRVLVLAALLAAACGETAPLAEVGVRVTAGVERVAPGRAFPLTVVRVWDGDDAPPEPDLAPLRTRLVATERREADGRVEETRTYDAWAFRLTDLAEPVELVVEPALDPARPGPAELPDAPAPGPSPWWLAFGLFALAAPLLLRRRRKRAPPPPPEPAGERPGPDARALADLARLRGRAPRTPEDYVETAAIVRGYVGERFRVHSDVMTTEELLGVAAGLARVLPPCDRVKFAGARPDESERESVLAAAEAFVRETA